MAKQFIYRTVKKTRGTEVVGSSQINEGTGGSGSGGGSISTNPTLGELLNVSSGADSPSNHNLLKWNKDQGLWVISTNTLGGLDNVDPITDNPDVGDSFAVLGTNNNGVSYKPFTLPESLGGAVFEGDVSDQQTNAFVVDFGKDLGDNYNLEVVGWNEKTVDWQGQNVTIRNTIQSYDIIKTSTGFSVKFFEDVDFLSYKALTTVSPSPTPEAPHATIRMNATGLMDFSVSGATGVKWIMQDGTVFDQDSQVPSGDINHPKIMFSGAGWVKLYCDDFSVVQISGGSTSNRCVSNLEDFSVASYGLLINNMVNITGDVNILSDITYRFGATNLDKITGDISKFTNATNIVSCSGCINLTSNSSELNCSATTMNFKGCNFSQLEINNLIKYNYDLNNTNKTLNITNNSIPDTATLAMIQEMTTNRGWTIYYDTE